MERSPHLLEPRCLSWAVQQSAAKLAQDPFIVEKLDSRRIRDSAESYEVDNSAEIFPGSLVK